MAFKWLQRTLQIGRSSKLARLSLKVVGKRVMADDTVCWKGGSECGLTYGQVEKGLLGKKASSLEVVCSPQCGVPITTQVILNVTIC